MKKILTIGVGLLMACFFNGCTRNFEEINTNKNKFYDVEINQIFPGTVSRTMKLIAEMNYNKILNFSRYSVVQFATNPSQDIGDNFFNQFYVGIVRDLKNLELEYDGKQGFENRLAIVKTWKAYMYYMFASTYGGIPMSDAIAAEQNKRTYTYDSEKQVYTQILEDLKAANMLYNLSPAPGDFLSTDPVFGGASNGKSDLSKWQKFTNTLRLNVALHVQNLSMDLAREHAMDVMKDPSKLISAVDDIVTLRWGKDADLSASYYFTRLIKNAGSFSESTYPAISEYFSLYLFSFNDARIEAFAHKGNALAPNAVAPFLHTDTLTRKHALFCGNNVNNPSTYCPNYILHQADGLNNMRKDSILVDYAMPYVPLVELNSLASGWEWEFVPGKDYRFSDPLTRKNSPYNYSFVHNNFLKEDATMVLLNWADACFLKAEAAILFGTGNAQQFYEEGIKASYAQYNLSSKLDDYMKKDGIAWNTSAKGFADRRLLYRASINGKGGNSNHLEQIYKQRYIADFFNALEGWNLERRTRVLRFPPFFANGAASDVEGYNSTYNYWTERMVYPLVEQSKNQEAYYQGIENLKMESPFYRSDRWGDNVYTSLGFTKKNPDLAIADYLWGGNKRISANVEYFNKKYGKTYEEVVATAKTMTGEGDENTALKKAFNYNFRSLLNTYIPQ
ncbi:MAG: SusD/RagB family nutrient-binding outer membrane lipoprotein [Sphingobacterium sp.]|jgi:hypothetical protein|nr:SusD/RagB family nutrient-binding outer membrane lipoprotein [Sphingobacterium sp.]